MTGPKEIVHRVMRQGIGVLCALLLVPYGVPVFAQDPVPAEPQGSPPPAQLLTPDQLNNLVAPIALYPDPLLTQVLVASTYPLEIVEAAQWLQQNRNLQGQQLADAARQQNWDPSIQALVVFPDIISRLSSNISWTTDLGNAFLAQQADVMNAVQTMRARARAAGRLNSDAEQTVTTQTQGGQSAIAIAPADPQVMYVPQYNPEYVWGPPAWGYYPPLYYPAVGFGFGFGAGVFVGSFFGGWGGWGGWGWGPNWFNCTVVQNGYFFNHYGYHNYYGGHGYYGGYGAYGHGAVVAGGVWAHNPYHRQGVPYSNAGLANRFGGSYAGNGGTVRGGFGGYRGGAYSSGPQGTGSAPTGWRRFGDPNASGVQRGSTLGGGFQGSSRSFAAQGNGGVSGGWRRFGEPNAYGAQRGEFNGGAYSGSRPQSPQVPGNGGTYDRSQIGRAPQAGTGSWNRSNSFTAPANPGSGFRSSPSSGSSFGGGSAPAYRQAPNAGGSGFRSSPSYRGSFGGGSAPAYRQAPNAGSSGFRSAPSFGGGRSFGGSQPSFSGGGGGGFHGGGGGGFRGGSGGGGGSHGGGGGSHGGGGGSHGARR